jgi:hypothetical protein
MQGKLGGRQYLQRGRLRHIQRRDLHLSSNPHGLRRRRLDPGLDAVLVAHGWIVYRQPDAHSHSASHANANSNTGANSYTDAESGPRMQRNSDLDCDCDLHWRTARDPEWPHLRSQVVDSKPESCDQLRPRRPLAAYRPLRPDANSNSYTGANSYADAIANANTAAGRDAQDDHILHPMGHLWT